MKDHYRGAILLGLILALASVMAASVGRCAEAEEKRASDSSSLSLRGHERWVTSVAFHPDGERIVSGSSDDTVKVWDSRTGKELMTLRVGGKGVTQRR